MLLNLRMLPDNMKKLSAKMDFFASGEDRTPESTDRWREKRIGLASVEQIEIESDGNRKRVRTLNGDETHQGRHIRIGVDDFEILHVKLYEYE